MRFVQFSVMRGSDSPKYPDVLLNPNCVVAVRDNGSRGIEILTSAKTFFVGGTLQEVLDRLG